MLLRLPRSTCTDTLCPYTTLFLSVFALPLFHRLLGLVADLLRQPQHLDALVEQGQDLVEPSLDIDGLQYFLLLVRLQVHVAGDDVREGGGRRSEEHTSELQSLMRISYAVFCLKKKKQTATCTGTTNNGT